ncbi:MAG: hypothetical protein WAM85_04065 [Terracidiphilus sp.]
MRRTRPVGTSPREALDAWQLHSGILAGEIEPPEEEAATKAGRSTTIRAAVDEYLAEMKATKGEATWRAYPVDLAGSRRSRKNITWTSSGTPMR